MKKLKSKTVSRWVNDVCTNKEKRKTTYEMEGQV